MTGTQVTNPEGRNLGEVEEVLLDMDAGRLAYAVLCLGGRLLPVPWKALRLRPEEKLVILDIDAGRLECAPSFARREDFDLADREWGTRIHGFYGVPEYWN